MLDRAITPARKGVLLFTVLVLTLAFSFDAQAATLGQDFNSAYKSFHSLLTNRSKARYRSNWQKVDQKFQKLYSRAPSGSTAPKALYYLGRINEELGKRSGLRSDFRRAIDYFARVVKRFPNHGWADDCIYRKAQIRYTRLNERTLAKRDLQGLLTTYPQADMAKDARKTLKRWGVRVSGTEVVKKKPASKTTKKVVHKPVKVAKKAAHKPAPKPKTTLDVAMAKAAAAKETKRPAVDDAKMAEILKPKKNGNGHTDPPNTPHLDNIRFKSSNEYTRVVLELDGQVQFRYKLLQPSPAHDRPHRLYLDLKGARISNGVSRNTTVSDGILKQIRAGQNDKDTTRVVLDFNALQDFKVFPLSNPFRIVIDVYSKSTAAPVKKTRVVKRATPKKRTKYKAPYGSRKLTGDLIEQLGLTIRTIMIDPGHGGKDAGAVAYKLREKDINLRFAKILGKMLEDKGFKVLYTRTTDVFLALEQRTAIANVKKADLFLSIHCNASRNRRANGLETYSLNLARTNAAVRIAARENAVDQRSISDLQYILADLMVNSKMKESQDLAKGVQRHTLRSVRKRWKLRDRGVHEAPFYVLMGAKMPSILLELGFITYKTEARLLNSDAYLNQLARGVVQGILAYKKQIERYASLN